MEKRICQLVYASQIEVIRSSRDSLTSPAAPPEGLTELPSCPVCLEKLVRDRERRDKCSLSLFVFIG